MPVPVTLKTDADLIEVFSSIQGEGPLVGCRQIFVRFAHCNLRCGYCDTAFRPMEACRCESAPGSGQFLNLPNPVSLETLSNILNQWDSSLPGAHHSLSLTGGEPLMQIEALIQWLPVLRDILPVYIETNGTLPSALEKVIDYMDYVSMDLKLSSVSGQVTQWDSHREFLWVANTKNTWVKSVVGEETTFEEIETAARLVHEVAPQAPFVLQPLTLRGAVGISASHLLELQTRASLIHSDTRAIPQTHTFVGLI